MMKKLILFFTLTIPLLLQAQPVYQWAKSVGAANTDEGRSVTYDSQGNILIAGTFSGSVDFDPSGPGGSLVASGSEDLYIVKYDASGNYLWAFNMGSMSITSGQERLYAITVDASDNIYVTGFINSSFDADPGIGVVNVGSVSGLDIFLASYTSAGNYRWAHVTGASGNDVGHALCVGNGKLYATGYFNNAPDFDPGGNTYTMASAGGNDIFLTSYDLSTGSLMNAVRFGSTGEDIGRALSIRNTEVFVAGYFEGTMDTDPSASVVNITSAGIRDAFIGTYSAGLNFVQSLSFGGAQNDVALGIAHDNTGKVLVTGYFSATADFDPVGTVNRTSAGGPDLYVAQYSSALNYQWVATAGSAGTDIGNSIVTDAQGACYVTGQFQGIVDFDPSGNTSNISSNGSGYTDIFVAKYNASGAYQFAFPIGGNTVVNDVGYGIALNSSSQFVVTGAYTGTADFNPGPGVNQYSSAGNGDIFIAKYGLCSAPDQPVLIASDTISCEGETVTFSIQSGNLNGAAQWQWYLGGCGSNPAGTGSSINIAPGISFSSIYVRGEGGCVSVPANCGSLNFIVSPNPSATITISPPNICENASPITPSTGPPGGVLGGPGINGNNFIASAAGPGNHYISYTITDNYSCVWADSMMINVIAIPVVSLSVPNDTVCINDTPLTLTGTPQGGIYAGPGVSGSQFIPANAGAGTYPLTYSYVSNGCFGYDTLFMTVLNCNTGTEMQNPHTLISLMPNPVQSTLTISIPGNAAMAEGEIISVNGEKLSSFIMKGETHTISLESLPTGIYLIRWKEIPAVSRFVKL